MTMWCDDAVSIDDADDNCFEYSLLLLLLVVTLQTMQIRIFKIRILILFPTKCQRCGLLLTAQTAHWLMCDRVVFFSSSSSRKLRWMIFCNRIEIATPNFDQSNVCLQRLNYCEYREIVWAKPDGWQDAHTHSRWVFVYSVFLADFSSARTHADDDYNWVSRTGFNLRFVISFAQNCFDTIRSVPSLCECVTLSMWFEINPLLIRMCGVDSHQLSF